MTDSSTLLTIAKSKAAANRAAKTLTVAQLEKAIANLSAAMAAVKQRESEKEERRKAADLKKLTAMMEKLGLSAEEVAGAVGKKPGRGKAKRKAKTTRGKSASRGSKVAPKYALEANGEKHLWTGRGRMPVVFREFVEKGGSLDTLLIKG